MGRTNFVKITAELTARLQTIDFNQLAISDYNKRYISQMKPALGYYLKIYSHCLSKGLFLADRDPSSIILVDYGGGSGFLSLLAKAIGIGKVIYIDLNPLSVKAISVLKEEVGLGPDVILEGNSDRLVHWCTENQIEPHLLIATDLIEHVYDLDLFLRDLRLVSPAMQLLFTTASTPYNPIVKSRLRQLMVACEVGDRVSPNYFTARLRYIQEQYPHFTEKQAEDWSRQTRGLIYNDIKKVIETNQVPVLSDTYNTCDPASGNWTERILPIVSYRLLAGNNGYVLKVDKGFYNTERSNPLKTAGCKCINSMISLTGKAGFLLAPFIVLIFLPENK